MLDREVEVEVDGDRVTVGGRTFSASLGAVPGTPVRQLLLDGRSEGSRWGVVGAGRWALDPTGERVELEVLDERTRHIRGLTAAGDRPRRPAALKAPMPGLVVRVQVEAGQTVPAGGGIVVLEAMKMENELRAPSLVVIKSVQARLGRGGRKGPGPGRVRVSTCPVRPRRK